MLVRATQPLRLSNASLTAFHYKSKEIERALHQFDVKVDSVLLDPRISDQCAEFVRTTWQGEDRSKPITMAQRPVREALSKAVMLALLRHCEQSAAATRGSHRLRMLSTCPDIGYCDYRDGELRLDAVRKQLLRWMRRHRLEGLAFVDVALVDLDVCGRPTEIGLHFHAACQSVPGTTEAAPDHKSRRKSKRRNKYGLAVAQQDIMASPLTTADVAGLGYYVAKLSAGLKEDHDDLTRGSQAHWSSEHALRTLEVYSHFSPESSLVAVGSLGEELKHESMRIFQRLLGRHDEEEQGAIKPNMRKWRRAYRLLGFDHLRPIRIRGLS